jgi:hypothetical protein
MTLGLAGNVIELRNFYKFSVNLQTVVEWLPARIGTGG